MKFPEQYNVSDSAQTGDCIQEFSMLPDLYEFMASLTMLVFSLTSGSWSHVIMEKSKLSFLKCKFLALVVKT